MSGVMLDRLTFACLLSLFGALFLSCDSVNSGHLERSQSQVPVQNWDRNQEKMASEWTRFKLPVDRTTTLFVNDGLVFALGSEGIAKLGSDGSVAKIELPSNRIELLSKDGGLSNFVSRPDSPDLKTSSNSATLCDPESAAVRGSRLYAISSCEHTGQLWSFDVFGEGNETSWVLNFTYETYPNSDTGDAVYGPNEVVKNGPDVFVRASLKNGPAILEILDQTRTLRKVWQGDASEGQILSLQLYDNSGLLLTQKGSLFRSTNGVTGWRFGAKIPDESVGKIWGISMVNPEELLAFGSGGTVIQSSDQGNNWKFEPINNAGSLEKMECYKGLCFVLSEFESLYLRKEGTWREFGLPSKGRIDDILIDKGHLYVLSGEIVFRLDLRSMATKPS